MLLMSEIQELLKFLLTKIGRFNKFQMIKNLQDMIKNKKYYKMGEEYKNKKIKTENKLDH